MNHYLHGNGENLRLEDIGLLGRIIYHARAHPQEGTYSIFKRVENQVLKKAHQNGAGDFIDDFKRGYSFGEVRYVIGGALVGGIIEAHVEDKEEFLFITADVYYHFADFSIDYLDFWNLFKEPDLDIGSPYYILGDWSTRIEAIVRK